MKVAIDISPLATGHRVRGIGAYTKRLIEQLQKGNYDLELEFFESPALPSKAEIIHYPYFDLFFHTLPIKKITNRIITVHDVIPLVFPSHFPKGIRGNINLVLQKLSLKNSDYVICDSQTAKGDIFKKLSYPLDKIKVIYLAAGENFKITNDKEKLQRVLKKFKIPQKFALYVGDVNWHKNLPNLLYAIKIANVNLVMVGAALKEESLQETINLNLQIKKLNLEKKVFKTGYTEEQDLVSLYNLAQVTVLPSFYEGFGLPILESFACGTPVICSKISSLEEIGKNLVFYCNPQNSFDFAKIIKETFNLSSRKRDLFSQKAANYAQQFSWKKTADETVEVYKQASQ